MRCRCLRWRGVEERSSFLFGLLVTFEQESKCFVVGQPVVAHDSFVSGLQVAVHDGFALGLRRRGDRFQAQAPLGSSGIVRRVMPARWPPNFREYSPTASRTDGSAEESAGGRRKLAEGI